MKTSLLVFGIAAQTCSSEWQQCGGAQYNGPKCCLPGLVCKVQDQYYSQCQKGTEPVPDPPKPTQDVPVTSGPKPTSAPGIGIEYGTVTPNFTPSYPIKVDGKMRNTKLTIDANWRWIHTKNGFTNCYDGKWNKDVCPDDVTCAKNCVIEGVTESQYRSTYGVATQGSSVKLDLVTGTNIGSRLYLLDEKNDYFGFDLVNREFSFTVDVSKLGCGVNAAMYFVHMDLTQPDTKLAGPAYGIGYGDAQCPSDIKYVKGLPNTATKPRQVCSPEMDIWEANSISNAFTPHPCKNDRIEECIGDVDCGNGPYRHKGMCDKDGGDFQFYRQNVTDFYGPGMKVDTMKPMRVITQFLTEDGTDNGALVGIKRFYIQQGKVIDGGLLTDAVVEKWKTIWQDPNHFKELGGMKMMGKQLKEKMVMIISIWGDTAVNMAWLDGTWPKGSTLPGAKRGTCPDGTYEETIAKNGDASAIFSDFEFGPIKKY